MTKMTVLIWSKMNFKWVSKLKTYFIVPGTLGFTLSVLIRKEAYINSENNHRIHKKCHIFLTRFQINASGVSQ